MATADAKAKRYDRQIRIWGAEGQTRLESARVALLNGGPTGTETLKNLVLGGIASFTVVDGGKVQPRDLGNNFLIDADGLGQSRAQVATRLLKELNESVSGSYVEEAPEALIASRPEFLDAFDLVVATQMREPDLIKLDDLCRSKGVTLLIVRAYGLMGYLRASVAEHAVIESKPDANVQDLRITAPWPDLMAFAESFDLPNLDNHTYKHLPYVVLLLQASQAWRRQHDGRGPSTSQERSAFKQQLLALRRITEEGVPLDEENLDEAVKAAFQSWTAPSIPSEVAALMADEEAAPSTTSSKFWIMVAALRAFVEQEGQGTLPLEGSIPDMHASTELYLKLQGIYRAQADREAAAFAAHARAIAARLGHPPSHLTSQELRHFCRNARNVRMVRCRPLAQEASGEGGRGSRLAAQLSGEGAEAANAALLVLLRACDRFYATHGRYPGAYASEVEVDVPGLKAAAVALLGEMGAGGAAVQDDYVHEMCRFGAAELHVVAAVMGGMAAQEAIKLITRQFVPVGGTLVYNAMASTTSTFEL